MTLFGEEASISSDFAIFSLPRPLPSLSLSLYHQVWKYASPFQAYIFLLKSSIFLILFSSILTHFLAAFF